MAEMEASRVLELEEDSDMGSGRQQKQ